MQTLIGYLGEPFRVTEYNSHQWKIGRYIFSVTPRDTSKHGRVYLFNTRDEKGKSCSGGCWTETTNVIEAVRKLKWRVEKETQE